MSPAFRNVDVPAGAPVEAWPFEALVSTIEREGIRAWARITTAIDAAPWGETARAVEHYLSYARPWGVAPLLERALQRARAEQEDAERSAVAAEIADLIARSGLTMETFARRIGTSRSRLSTYRSGTVVPSATLMLRMRRLAEQDRAIEPEVLRPLRKTPEVDLSE